MCTQVLDAGFDANGWNTPSTNRRPTLLFDGGGQGGGQFFADPSLKPLPSLSEELGTPPRPLHTQPLLPTKATPAPPVVVAAPPQQSAAAAVDAAPRNSGAAVTHDVFHVPSYFCTKCGTRNTNKACVKCGTVRATRAPSIGTPPTVRAAVAPVGPAAASPPRAVAHAPPSVSAAAVQQHQPALGSAHAVAATGAAAAELPSSTNPFLSTTNPFATPPSTTPPVTASPPSGATMMAPAQVSYFCTKCGTRNTDATCVNCGAVRPGHAIPKPAVAAGGPADSAKALAPHSAVPHSASHHDSSPFQSAAPTQEQGEAAALSDYSDDDDNVDVPADQRAPSATATAAVVGHGVGNGKHPNPLNIMACLRISRSS